MYQNKEDLTDLEAVKKKVLIFLQIRLNLIGFLVDKGLGKKDPLEILLNKLLILLLYQILTKNKNILNIFLAILLKIIYCIYNKKLKKRLMKFSMMKTEIKLLLKKRLKRKLKFLFMIKVELTHPKLKEQHQEPSILMKMTTKPLVLIFRKEKQNKR